MEGNQLSTFFIADRLEKVGCHWEIVNWEESELGMGGAH
jgi:hypothetical protein